jgi:site-specific recombinase XerD
LQPITIISNGKQAMSSALATIAAPALPAVVQAELDTARAFALAEKSPATRRAYKSDFRHFTRWCGDRGASPMPAAPDLVSAYLAALATAGAKASTIGRRPAAIRYAHRLAGFEPPTNVETVKATLRGIRREIGTAKVQKAPATADRIADMVRGIPDTLIGKRDRALLLLGFAGAFRRSELVALTVADLIEVEGGLRVVIRQSKTDQEGAGQEIAIPHGSRLRPVEAVRAWLTAAGITGGPLFRPIAKGGRVAAVALSDRSVAAIVKHHAERAGLDPVDYAGHSLRAGFITSAAEEGAALLKIAEQSRHKSLDTLRGYVRTERRETVPNMGVITLPCEMSGDAGSCCRDLLQALR